MKTTISKKINIFLLLSVISSSLFGDIGNKLDNILNEHIEKDVLGLEPMFINSKKEEKVDNKLNVEEMRYTFDIPTEEVKIHDKFKKALLYGNFGRASFLAFQLFQENTVRKKSDIRMAVALLDMGTMQTALGYPQKAWHYHEKAYYIFNKFFEKNKKKYAIDFYLAALDISKSMIYQENFRLEAKTISDRAGTFMQSAFRTVDRNKMALALLDKAKIQSSFRDYESAIGSYRAAVSFVVIKPGGYSLEYAIILIEGSKIFLDSGTKLPEAKKNVILGIKMIKGMIKNNLFKDFDYKIDDNFYMIGKGLQTLSELYKLEGKSKKAIAASKRSISILEKAYSGKETSFLSRSYIFISNLLIENERYEEALVYLDKAQDLSESYASKSETTKFKINKDSTLNSAIIYAKKSEIFFKQNNFEKAKENMQKSYDIYSEILGWWDPQAKMAKESLSFIKQKYKEHNRF